jgi:hypothetical protein
MFEDVVIEVYRLVTNAPRARRLQRPSAAFPEPAGVAEYDSVPTDALALTPR